MNLPAYLDRLGYAGPTQPTAAVLRELHRAHLLTVPFENLDIALGRKIVCDEEAFVRKVVQQRRGGFCYELNGAFAALLRALGFRVTLLSARVPRADGSQAPEFDHLVLRVDLEEPWLADVGFGDCFLDPLQLKLNVEQPQSGGCYRLVEDEDSLHVQRIESEVTRPEVTRPEENWKEQYSFTLVPRSLLDFAAMCHYHQTSPESPFTQKSVCTRATREGRITLANRKLITTRAGARHERLLDSEEELRAALKTYFGITLDA